MTRRVGGDGVSDKKRAWKDAQQDCVYEKAGHRLILWRVFWSVVLLGLGYRFFGVEIYD